MDSVTSRQGYRSPRSDRSHCQKSSALCPHLPTALPQSDPIPSPRSPPAAVVPPPKEAPLCSQQTPPAPPPFLPKHLAHSDKVPLQPKHWDCLSLTSPGSHNRRQKSCCPESPWPPVGHVSPFLWHIPCFLRLTPLTGPLRLTAVMHGLQAAPTAHMRTHTHAPPHVAVAVAPGQLLLHVWPLPRMWR